MIRNLIRGKAPATLSIPLFPLGTVLFPDGVLSLKLFEQRYLDMAKRCFKDASPFGVCLIQEGAEVGTPAVPMPVGTLARISDWDMEQLGVLKIKATGGERFRALKVSTQPDGLVVAEVELRPFADNKLPADAAPIVAFLQSIMQRIGHAQFAQPFKFDDVHWVSFRLAEILPLRSDVRQKLLELDDGANRLTVIERFLREQRLIA